MQNIPAPSVRNPRPAQGALALVCGGVLLCGGCFSASRPAPSLGRVTLAHPVAPRVTEVALTDAPEIPHDASDPIPELILPRKGPARPRVPVAPVKEPVVAAENPEPIIAPELSDEQLSGAKTAIEQSLSVAEHNLSLTKAMTLSPAQQDLVSKILGFQDSAREAMKNNDWQRARIQAKKAEVLSQEFAPKQ
jgi:hypothetical protein